LIRFLSQMRLPHLNFKLYLIVFVMGFFAVIFGFLAVTANPVMIGLGAGMVLAPIFLLMPEFTIWVILVIGFLFGILSASPQFSKLAWIVSLLSMLLLIPALFNMLWSKQRQLPGFMLIALMFLVFSVFASVIRWYSMEEFIAGFKRYFQTFGLMLALSMLVFSSQSYIRWRNFLMIVALLQFPFALYELLVLVPLRGGLSLSSETTDVVAGTFGANLQGGSPSSVMVVFLFIALSFLIARWRIDLISSKRFFIFALICLLPLGMGETKIAVVMLPMVGMVLLRKDFIQAPMRYLPAILAMVLLTGLLTYLYVVVMMHSSLDEVIDATLRYNVGTQGYSKSQSLNRMTSISFWAQQQSLSDPLGFLIGNGLGSSYTSSGAMAGHLGLKYSHYGINLTAASSLLWDTGLIGFSLFLSLFVAAWFAAERLYNAANDPAVKGDALAIQAAVSLFLLSLIYSDSIVNLVSMELIYALVLGYLGYLMNHHGLLNRPSVVNPSLKRHA
jgi:hypothetical protein